jgi:excisionase family DNA binding protein
MVSTAAITDTPQLTTYDLDAVAGVLGCTRRHVERLVSDGRLAALKVGRLTRVSHAELHRFVTEGGSK